MKALTLHQPWASLIALGAKTIETRSWSTTYRGPLAIHAGRRCATGNVGAFNVEKDNPRGAEPAYLLRSDALGWPYRLPLGAVVAVCTLVDVVPISPEAASPVTAKVREFPHEGELPHQQGGLWLIGIREPWGGVGRGTPLRVEDQRAYGDYTPGRYAWLLDNVHVVLPPVAAVGHQRLWEWDDQS